MSKPLDLESPSDPYAPRPTFVQRHADAVAAAAVFVLTVALAVFAFPPFNAPEAAYAMLIPGTYWAYTRPRLKLFVLTLGAAQAVAWTLILGWLHHVTMGGLLLLGPFIGAWVGTWYLGAWWAIPRMLGQPTLNRLLIMLGLAGLWVVIEWTRTWLLSGFPWMSLAASQWQRPSILQIAAYTGSYGISFVLVAANIGFAAYAHRLFREQATGFNKRSQEFFLALFLLLGCLCVHFQDAFGRLAYSEPLARVGFVQPYIPQAVKWDASKTSEIVGILEQTTREAALGRPDVILWPEASTPWAIKGDASVQRFAERVSRDAKAPLLLGSIAIENPGPQEQWLNGAFVVSPEFGLQTAYYGKRHLVPFGEYVPFRPLFGWLKKFVPVGDDFTPGPDASPLIVSTRRDPIVFGPLVCYEDIFPDLARRSVLAGSEALVVVTNNAWYGEGAAAYQHAAHSVLRAVETRRPVLRCGNGGWSGWIDEFGAIRAVLTRDADGNIFTQPQKAAENTVYFRGAAVVEVTRDARWKTALTFYTRHGDWFVLVSAVLIALGVGVIVLAERAARPSRFAPKTAE